MSNRKEAPKLQEVVLIKWKYNPKTRNIASGPDYPPDPLYGHSLLSHYLLKIDKKTLFDPDIWESWYGARPIKIIYDANTAYKECMSLPTTHYKAIRIEPVKNKQI